MKTTKKEKNYYAILTLSEFPKDENKRKNMAFWLRKVASQIEEANPEEYSDTPRFRLMK